MGNVAYRGSANEGFCESSEGNFGLSCNEVIDIRFLQGLFGQYGGMPAAPEHGYGRVQFLNKTGTAYAAQYLGANNGANPDKENAFFFINKHILISGLYIFVDNKYIYF
ncbi:MAG: hypothetical protein BWY70_01394 [Bacteroidetes bacterium ADurb.Bin408]|nr:MAG: hypothetical protein BWY70_01394 [Bacteroidetes bacterium ADurb.Bin408]